MARTRAEECRMSSRRARLVAQALAGPALKGGQLGDVSPTGEVAAWAKLTANWRSDIEGADVTAAEINDRRRRQTRLKFQ